jgi:hypothetical protein
VLELLFTYKGTSSLSHSFQFHNSANNHVTLPPRLSFIIQHSPYSLLPQLKLISRYYVNKLFPRHYTASKFNNCAINNNQSFVTLRCAPPCFGLSMTITREVLNRWILWLILVQKCICGVKIKRFPLKLLKY